MATELVLHSGISDFQRARREIANPGDYAEALATTALDALNHLLADEKNTVRIGKWVLGIITEDDDEVR